MKSCQELLEILKKEKPSLASKFKVSKLGVFGSYARNEASPDSDIDILVDVDPSIGLNFVVLADALEEMLGLPVDLVSRRSVKEQLLELIEKEIIYA